MLHEPLDPLVQSLAANFLMWIASRRDDDIGSLARFERALVAARRGTLPFPVTVHWRCHPMDAFAAALHEQPLPDPQPYPVYVTEIAQFLPDNFLIRKISATHLRVA
jgi:hypothetical protein